jgi:hypothetical protein
MGLSLGLSLGLRVSVRVASCGLWAVKLLNLPFSVCILELPAAYCQMGAAPCSRPMRFWFIDFRSSAFVLILGHISL